jgi:hypothetical protein
MQATERRANPGSDMGSNLAQAVCSLCFEQHLLLQPLAILRAVIADRLAKIGPPFEAIRSHRR